MKNLFFIAAFLGTTFLTANAQNHYFTPNRNIVAKGKTTVYFVTQNPEKYDWVKWDFGDGQTEYSINPAHEYSKAGVYDVKMLVAKGATVDTFCKNGFVTILPNGNSFEDGDFAMDFDISKENFKSIQNNNNPNLIGNFENCSITILNSSGNSGLVEIRNINGEIMCQNTIYADETIKTLPLEMLNKGLYIAYLTTNNKTIVKKIYKN